MKKSILSKIKKHLFSSNFSLKAEWNFIRKKINIEYEFFKNKCKNVSRNSKIKCKLIIKKYRLRLVQEVVPNLIIYCLDGRTAKFGFADRIKGMVSCYAYAKAINVPFRIEHIVPFDLSVFLVPNKYDWLLKVGEKSYNLLYCNPVFFIQYAKCRHRSMRLFRINKNRQYHLFTNLSYIKEINERFNKNYKFGELYQELFKPSLVLEKKINEQKIKKGEYISISFRFMQLMGDFKDCRGDILSEEDRNDLLYRSLSLVESLYEKKQKTILVTSDSQTFIDAVSKLNYVYVIPGRIGHIGYSEDEDDEIYEKVLLDFYMISQATHVYMAHSGKMYRSGFAYTAAMTTDAPYDEISY